jgi:NCS2 family nucleobase:cation symporter-2/xanthine permease XanP
MHQPENDLRYAVDEAPPHWLSALLGFQVVVLIIAGITLTPIIVLKASGTSMASADWVVFAALLVSGLTTMAQSRPIGPFGAGYVLFMGTSGAFIAIAITAIHIGGIPLLATLIVASSLVEFLFAARLGLLRRIVTPAVGGTVITLIAVTVFPIAFRMLEQTPADFSGPAPAAAWTAIATFFVTVAISLFGRGQIRLWGPLIGIIFGSLLASPLGLLDLSGVRNAAWVGLPSASWPGLDLTFDSRFWLLLPGFVIVTIVGALETYGDGIAIQEISRRGDNPIDYHVVQGAVHADGLGNLLSGIMGTLPNTTYSTSISVVDLTGVGARRVGLYGGGILALLAFSPKVSALLQAIPPSVMGAFIVILLVLLFVHGVRLLTAGGLSYENGIVVGLGFWLGVGFQDKAIFPDLMPEWAHSVFDNGMTSGGVTALVLSLLLSLKVPKARMIRLPAAAASITELHGFMQRLGLDLGWGRSSIARLELVSEEALMFLVERDLGSEGTAMPGITVKARSTRETLELEFVAAPAGANMQALIRQLQDAPSGSVEDTRLRILSQLVSELSHQQFKDSDYLLIRLDSDREAYQRED